MAQMCTLANFSRTGYYRSLQPEPKPTREDLELRDAMHRIAPDWSAYGSRRMAHELKKQGWKVNRKDNLTGSEIRPCWRALLTPNSTMWSLKRQRQRCRNLNSA